MHVLTFTSADSLARALHNALIFAGTDGALPMLASVWFEFDGKLLTVAATDSKRLSVENVTPDGSTPVEFSFLIQRDAVKSILTTLKASKDPITFMYAVSTGRLTVITLQTSAEYRTDTDHKFPAFRSLIPTSGTELPLSEISFSPRHLADLGKVQTASKTRTDKITIKLYGENKATRIDFNDGPIVLIMPT